MNKTRIEQGVLAAAAVAIVSLFLPWLKIVAPFVGELTVTPTDGGKDGWIILVGVVLVVGLTLAARKTGALVLAVLTGALVAFEVIDLLNRVSEANAVAPAFASVTYGAGLFLTIGATIALVIFAVKNRNAVEPVAVEQAPVYAEL